MQVEAVHRGSGLELGRKRLKMGDLSREKGKGDQRPHGVPVNSGDEHQDRRHRTVSDKQWKSQVHKKVETCLPPGRRRHDGLGYSEWVEVNGRSPTKSYVLV